jgi:hypothetical protein
MVGPQLDLLHDASRQDLRHPGILEKLDDAHRNLHWG